MPDEFMAAADSVNHPPRPESERYVEVEFEKRKYPTCPIGMFPAICVKAEQKDANPNGQYYKPGDKRIHLRWQIVSPTYKDPEDPTKERHYMVFSRPLPVSFGDRSHLYKLWMKLTGTDVEDFLVQTAAKLPLSNGKFKDVIRKRLEHTLLENMTANIVIEHQEWNGEMRANIANYIVNEAQKAKNFQQLPGMANVQAPKKREEGAQEDPAEQPPVSMDFLDSPTVSKVPDTPLYKSPIKESDLPF